MDKKLLVSARFHFDPRFKNIYLSNREATDAEITAFFKSIWWRSVLNAGLIFWNGIIKIYTYFPYQQRFLVKVFECMVVEGHPMDLPSDTFDTLFSHNADNLANTSFRVFIGADTPKVFGFPSRYHLSAQYHFGGRDGLVALNIEQAFHGSWQYYTITKRFGIIGFDYNLTGSFDDPADTWGRKISPDNYELNNPRLKFFNAAKSYDLS